MERTGLYPSLDRKFVEPFIWLRSLYCSPHIRDGHRSLTLKWLGGVACPGGILVCFGRGTLFALDKSWGKGWVGPN